MRSFDQEWPELASRLAVTLARYLPSSRREDIIQETGLRVFSMWDRIDPKRGPWPLTLTIALNLLRDEARRHNAELPGAVPEEPSAEDTERAALARLELQRVERAIRSLKPAYRRVLLAEWGGELIDNRATSAMKMTRLRARRALSALLDRSSTLAACPLGYARRFSASVQQLLRGTTGEQLVPAAAALSVIAVVALVSPSFDPPAQARPGTTWFTMGGPQIGYPAAEFAEPKQLRAALANALANRLSGKLNLAGRPPQRSAPKPRVAPRRHQESLLTLPMTTAKTITGRPLLETVDVHVRPEPGERIHSVSVSSVETSPSRRERPSERIPAPVEIDVDKAAALAT